MRLRMLRRGLVIGSLFSGLAFAQTTFQFQMRATLAGLTATVANQSTIPFATSVGQPQTAQFVATYVGSGKVTVSQGPQIFGSTEFTSNLSGTLPLTLSPAIASLSRSRLLPPAQLRLAPFLRFRSRKPSPPPEINLLPRPPAPSAFN